VIGVRAVRDQAVALLGSLGYPRDDEVGVPFDPVRQEVVTVVDDPEAPPGTVVKVLRAGYGRPQDRQLRPASVVVSRKPE
jgi:molecular chaperone GrpE